jgi:hypothetical protein
VGGGPYTVTIHQPTGTPLRGKPRSILKRKKSEAPFSFVDGYNDELPIIVILVALPILNILLLILVLVVIPVLLVIIVPVSLVIVIPILVVTVHNISPFNI